MRKGLGILSVMVLFSMIMLPLGECIADEEGLRYSISVAKFRNRSNWRGHYNLGDAWGAVLTDTLNQTGKFIVLGEKDMRREALQEQDFAASGRAAGGGKKVVKGQMTPAQLLIMGDITHFSDKTESGKGGFGYKGFRVGGKTSESEINVVMYIIDSSTGQLMGSKKCYGKISKTGLSFGISKGGFRGDVGGFKKTNAGKAMEIAVDEGVAYLISSLESIPWTGTVILAKNGKIYINRGEREGVSVGQTFDVGKSEILRDPDTGEVLDYSLEKVGTIQVLKVKKKLSICKVLNGQGIGKGMTVAPSK